MYETGFAIAGNEKKSNHVEAIRELRKWRNVGISPERRADGEIARLISLFFFPMNSAQLVSDLNVYR